MAAGREQTGRGAFCGLSVPNQREPGGFPGRPVSALRGAWVRCVRTAPGWRSHEGPVTVLRPACPVCAANARRDLGGRGHRSGDSFAGKRVTHRRFRNRAARRGAVSHGWEKGGTSGRFLLCPERKTSVPEVSKRKISLKGPPPLPFALYFTTSGRLKKEG